MSDDGINKERRNFLTAATTVVGAAGAAFAATPFVTSWQPSAKTQAAGAPVEVDISKLAPGAQITVAWRGKPIWIVHRTKEHLAALKSLDDKLRDPNSKVEQQPEYAKNEYRSRNPEILVLVGLCTHLGCVPTFKPQAGSIEADWQGGFYCPCHGSKYDMAGRVYKGVPAPSNMPVPPYQFLSDNVLLIGDDKGAA